LSLELHYLVIGVQLAQSLTGNMSTLECMNDRSGRRDNTADASADSGSVVTSFVGVVLVRDEFDVVADDVMALRIESSGDEWAVVLRVAPVSGSSRTSSSSFSGFLTATNRKKQALTKLYMTQTQKKTRH